jgi:hypothetical protein
MTAESPEVRDLKRRSRGDSSRQDQKRSKEKRNHLWPNGGDYPEIQTEILPKVSRGRRIEISEPSKEFLEEDFLKEIWNHKRSLEE